MKVIGKQNCKHTRAQSKIFLRLAHKFWIMLTTQKKNPNIGSVLTKGNLSKYLRNLDSRKNIWMSALKNVQRRVQYHQIASIEKKNQKNFVQCI